MLAFQGYYDGKVIRTLEKIDAKKNQKLIITILDEYMDDIPDKNNMSSKGLLSKYANRTLWDEENMAWEKAVSEKYGNA